MSNQLNYNGPGKMYWSLQMISLLSIDHRIERFSRAIILDIYPLHSVYDGTNSLEEAEVFRSIEKSWGYWQVTIKDEEKEKTIYQLLWHLLLQVLRVQAENQLSTRNVADITHHQHT